MCVPKNVEFVKNMKIMVFNISSFLCIFYFFLGHIKKLEKYEIHLNQLREVIKSEKLKLKT